MTFNLLRYYSLASLASIVLITALLGTFGRHLMLHELQALGEQSNVALAQSLSNALWPRLEPLLTAEPNGGLERLRQRAETAGLRQTLAVQLAGIPILKVKVYRLDGLTVFSSEAAQIGQDKSSDSGFLSARDGRSASALVHRDSFNAFEGAIENRDLIASYVPIRPHGPDGPIAGVFELYSDVTPLLVQMKETGLLLVAGSALILSLLYFALFFTVRHAHQVIKRQNVQRREMEHRLIQLAQYDALTGLPNRTLFHDRLQRALVHAGRSQQQVALLFLDLDGFKNVNDSLGHPVGDQLLQAVATRLSSAIRDSDTLSRLGGDEFTVILEQVGGPDAAARVAEKLIDALREPFDLGQHRVQIGVSIGIALFPREDREVDDLIKHADAAMYAAKEAGRGTYRFTPRSAPGMVPSSTAAADSSAS